MRVCCTSAHVIFLRGHGLRHHVRCRTIPRSCVHSWTEHACVCVLCVITVQAFVPASSARRLGGVAIFLFDEKGVYIFQVFNCSPLEPGRTYETPVADFQQEIGFDGYYR